MQKIWVFTFLILAACAPTAVSPTTTLPTPPNLVAVSTIPVTRTAETVGGTETAVMPLPTLSPSATFEPTAVLTPPPDPTPDSACPTSGTAEPFKKPGSIEELKISILGFLNSGGMWEELLPLLVTMGIEANLIEVDFNGDGVNETVINAALSLPDYQQDPAIWVFQCRFGKYNDIYSLRLGRYFVNAKVTHIMDLTNDGLPEVILESLFGGSSCFPLITVIGWKPSYGIVWYTKNQPIGIELKCTYLLTIKDLNADGIQEIMIEGSGVGPPGSTQKIIQTFQLTNEEYILISTEYLP